MRKQYTVNYSLFKPFTNYVWLILFLGLTACASPALKTPNSINDTPLVKTSCEAPSQYALRTLHWSDHARNEELERLAESLDSSKGYCTVLELAIFLSTPSKVFQDDRRALLLLEKLSKDERLTASEHNFVSRLLPHIEQRQNIRLLVGVLQTEIQRLKQKLK